jgi:hypothetical protein
MRIAPIQINDLKNVTVDVRHFKGDNDCAEFFSIRIEDDEYRTLSLHFDDLEQVLVFATKFDGAILDLIDKVNIDRVRAGL